MSHSLTLVKLIKFFTLINVNNVFCLLSVYEDRNDRCEYTVDTRAFQTNIDQELSSRRRPIIANSHSLQQRAHELVNVYIDTFEKGNLRIPYLTDTYNTIQYNTIQYNTKMKP